MTTALVWFRQDLRLADNPALRAAIDNCDQVLPVFIDDPADQSVSQVGAASRVWLHNSLHSLNESLQERGNQLLVVQGQAEALLLQLAEHYKVTQVFWNRCYDPVAIKRDKKIKTSLAAYQPRSFNALLNAEPFNTLKADGTPYRVYTPYWRMRCSSLPGEKPLAAPRNIPAPTKKAPVFCTDAPACIERLGLLPARSWPELMMSHWQVGEKAALKNLRTFLKNAVDFYHDERDIPATAGTSRMSPHLHFGEISPRQIMHLLMPDNTNVEKLSRGAETFAKEVIWREFAYTLLYHFPHTLQKPLDKRFDQFPWASGYTKNLRAWQQGQTGVPIVDAGMRELYATGWMHNRVRMVVASYLIKNLLIPWQKGEQWFRETLVDADLASNAMGWQWAAGSGADAAPYFRVFNPVLQGEKFDKQGDYVKRWVPELHSVEPKFIHKPWELPSDIRCSLDYPEPLVDLKASRVRALAAFEQIKVRTK